MANMPRIEEIQTFFFKGMERGWVAGGQSARPVPDKPGWWQSNYREGELTLTDQWIQLDNGKSFGYTMIWFGQKPVWVMHYQGHYDRQALPFLQSVLLATYAARQFFGGRGPEFHESFPQPDGAPCGAYTNDVTPGSTFGQFSGREEVFSRDDEPLGHHDYSGMILI